MQPLVDIQRTAKEYNSFIYIALGLLVVFIFTFAYITVRGEGVESFLFLSIFSLVIIANFFLYRSMKRERIVVSQTQMVYQPMIGREIVVDIKDLKLVEMEKEKASYREPSSYQAVFLDEKDGYLLKVNTMFLKAERRKKLFDTLKDLGVEVKA